MWLQTSCIRVSEGLISQLLGPRLSGMSLGFRRPCDLEMWGSRGSFEKGVWGTLDFNYGDCKELLLLISPAPALVKL